MCNGFATDMWERRKRSNDARIDTLRHWIIVYGWIGRKHVVYVWTITLILFEEFPSVAKKVWKIPHPFISNASKENQFKANWAASVFPFKFRVYLLNVCIKKKDIYHFSSFIEQFCSAIIIIVIIIHIGHGMESSSL